MINNFGGYPMQHKETTAEKIERLVADAHYYKGFADGLREFYYMQNPMNHPQFIAGLLERKYPHPPVVGIDPGFMGPAHD